jgi:hypothetical protein
METDQKEQLVIVKTFNNSFEANIAKSKLKESCIDSYIEDENVVGLNPLGETELKVFSKDLESAKQILSE